MRSKIHLIGLLLLLWVTAGLAQPPLTAIPESVKAVAPIPQIDAKSWILAEFDTGWVLGDENADLRIEPASLTKLMTSYLVFDALDKGQISLEDKVYVSKKAWKTGGSRMFIQVDTHVSVLDLLQGLIIQSGNDAAVALAEHIGGSEEAFAARMNAMAAELGMTGSHFTNSSGLPNANHYSTARDMTLLAISLIRRFPDMFRFYSQLEFTYNNITQRNRNVLLTREPGVDGIKTGYTKSAGYCLIGTAMRDGVRLIATVTGAESASLRARQVQSLLRYGYGAYDVITVFSPGDTVQSVPLWLGQEDQAGLGVRQALKVLFPKGQKDKLSAALELPESLEAPLNARTEVGAIAIKYDGTPVLEAALVTNNDLPEGDWMSRMLDHITRFIF